LHFNKIVGFQIEIFIYSDIYCSQASRRYPWRVLCKNQVNWTGSCATVWTPCSVLQINIDDVRTSEPHRPDARSISILQEVCSQKSTLIVKFQYFVWTTWHHVRTMFIICKPSGQLGNTSERYTVIQITPKLCLNTKRISVKTVRTLGQAIQTHTW
jgi:hypothetical protein